MKHNSSVENAAITSHIKKEVIIMDDLYPGAYTADTGSTNYADILTKMERLDTELRKVQKKKGSKKGGKKKLKKRLKALKFEYKQLKKFLKAFALQQNTVRQSSAWWQDALIKTLPKIIDIGTVVLNNVTQPRPQVLPAKSQHYLTDGSDRK